ncbi:MAG: tail fiber domain-containing protein [Phaeodactylibacter sp.]|nr:tail fiber domain-containing protein [Phaeodactylibacter sp.]MCB9264737.1 tail fiber domain-containing protein [Lewinellaceae bacterium]MCB9287766.1 tail fiber domain-containing protein [Lewinellaceae bacterium]
MALKSRLDLEGLFKNGRKISQNDFADLIESVLNKKDDKFLGEWKPGRVYYSGQVVFYGRGFWQVITGKENGICSHEPPSKENPDWQPLIVPVADNDWEVDEEAGVMYAKVYDCVGIGKIFEEPPGGRLEIIEPERSRFLFFPKETSLTTLSLFQLENQPEEGGEPREKTYFLTGLANDQVGFTTDTPMGFIFRKGGFCEEGQEGALDFREGDLLMSIRPDNSGLARVGISTMEPAGMLDITDEARGQFLFNPEDKEDPVFSIINLDPKCDKNYLSSGVGEDNAVFVTDANRGFVFRHGAEYGEYCAHLNINQGQGLMIVLRHEQTGKARVGIGTEDPQATLDVTDQEVARFQFQPDDKEGAVATITSLADGTYFTLGLGEKPEEPAEQARQAAPPPKETPQKSVLLTNAPGGFSFNQGPAQGEYQKVPQLNQGAANVVFREDGKVGIGTENPETRLEVTDLKSGRFRFNLDDIKVNPALGIVNTRPGFRTNYLTLGADNDTAILITDSKYGFSFRQGSEAQDNPDNEVDISQKSETLLSLRPGRKDEDTGLMKSAEMRVFPEAKDDTGIVHIKGRVGIRTQPLEYELNLEGMMRSFSLFLNTDIQKMSNVRDMANVMDKLKSLRPVSFKWDQATGYQEEGEQIGFVAHEVEEHFPEVVKTTPDPTQDNTKSVAYQNLVPVLVKAIQEQQEMIEKLKRDIEDLKRNNA